MCTQCGPGRAPDEGHTGCATCAVGRAGVSGACDACGDGSQHGDCGVACSACLVGKVGADGTCQLCATGREVAPNRTGCFGCVVGKVGVSGQCAECGDGQTAAAIRRGCKACPTGRAQLRHRTSSGLWWRAARRLTVGKLARRRVGGWRIFGRPGLAQAWAIPEDRAPDYSVF